MSTVILKQLREKMRDRGMDSLFVSGAANCDYLLGMTVPFIGACLVTMKDLCFFASCVDYEEAKSVLANARVELTKNTLVGSMGRFLSENRLCRLGVDASGVTHIQYEKIRNIRGIKLLESAGVIEALRMIKSGREVDFIRKACRISAFVFSRMTARLKPGISEQDAAEEIGSLMRRSGAEPAFDTIVASGVRSSFPHAAPTGKKIRNGDAVVMDFGARYKGYVSDLTRTVFMGSMGEKEKKIYGIVRNAQTQALNCMKDGCAAGRIDSAARCFIDKKGYGKYFVHSTGHGLGREIHEDPRIGRQDKMILKEGMIVTVEPGIYIPSAFGVRIEDTVLVTKKGSEILTDADRTALVL